MSPVTSTDARDMSTSLDANVSDLSTLLGLQYTSEPFAAGLVLPAADPPVSHDSQIPVFMRTVRHEKDGEKKGTSGFHAPPLFFVLRMQPPRHPITRQLLPTVPDFGGAYPHEMAHQGFAEPYDEQQQLIMLQRLQLEHQQQQLQEQQLLLQLRQEQLHQEQQAGVPFTSSAVPPHAHVWTPSNNMRWRTMSAGAESIASSFISNDSPRSPDSGRVFLDSPEPPMRTALSRQSMRESEI